MGILLIDENKHLPARPDTHHYQSISLKTEKLNSLSLYYQGKWSLENENIIVFHYLLGRRQEKYKILSMTKNRLIAIKL